MNWNASSPPLLVTVNTPPISKAFAPVPENVISPLAALPISTLPVIPTEPPPPIWGTVKALVPEPAVALIFRVVKVVVSPIFPPRVKAPEPKARIR